MDDSPRFDRLRKTTQRRLQKGWTGKHTGRWHGHHRLDSPQRQQQRTFQSNSRVRQRAQELSRQARWCENLRFPTYEDHHDTLDHCERQPFRWLNYDEDGFNEHDWWEEYWESLSDWGRDRAPVIEYLPGRREYECMEADPCPLCGGNCIQVLKRDVEEDLYGMKWRFPYDDYF